MRLLIASTENGEHEEVIFTRDFKKPATDFFPHDYTIDYDKKTLALLPDFFPMDYNLKRV